MFQGSLNEYKGNQQLKINPKKRQEKHILFHLSKTLE